MTAMCALLSSLSLMLNNGTGSELRQPLAMAGGLVVSRALTLFTSSVVYIDMDKLLHLLSRGKAKRRGASRSRRNEFSN